MGCSTEDENFTMKFDTGGRSSWPLPPSSVFKCKSAQPWLDPKLFRIITSGNYKHEGVMIMGDFLENETQFQQKHSFDSICKSEELEQETAEYSSEPVEVYGLPLPNSKIRAIEYSNNPEKGIDPGDFESNTEHRPKAGILKHSGSSHKVEHTHSFLQKTRENPNNGNGNQKKKKWSPFAKDKSQSRKLFY